MGSQLAANIISSIVAAATLAVVVTAYIAIKDNRKQTQQTKYNLSRPLLVPEGTPTFRGSSNMLDWSVNEQPMVIRNIGSGVALNVASVLYGCESYVVDFNRRSDQGHNRHWTCWLGLPIASGDTKAAIHKFGSGNFYEKNMHIEKHRFNAPPEPLPSPNPDQPYILARITITYLDIFRRKHASIFDYVQHTSGWQLVEFLENIKEDLSDLEG